MLLCTEGWGTACCLHTVAHHCPNNLCLKIKYKVESFNQPVVKLSLALKKKRGWKFKFGSMSFWSPEPRCNYLISYRLLCLEKICSHLLCNQNDYDDDMCFCAWLQCRKLCSETSIKWQYFHFLSQMLNRICLWHCFYTFVVIRFRKAPSPDAAHI